MSIHPTAIVDASAELGNGVEIGPYCTVGAKVRLHDGVRLISHVVLEGDTQIGEGTLVYPFASLGGPPQHLGCSGEGTALVVGASAIIREHVTMNRGTVAGGGVTRVGDRGFFMIGAHLAHDCQVGDDVIFANNATLGGHVTVGDRAFLGGLCAVHQHCRIGAYAFIGGGATVVNDVIPYASAFGNHARLVGLNVIGMKRRGVARDVIHDLRAAYRMLFSGSSVFQDRIEIVRERYGDREEVARILEFLEKDATRPLMPAR
ncbi:MAG: acyl-ACP--UDP-N-acetylglucosamine O-acyltransferase [Pseudomonadota bacterium]